MRLPKKTEGKKGIALIMALWIMTILLVVAASFAFMMRTEVRMAGNYRDGMKAHYLALAGVDHAIAVILADSGNVDHLYEEWFTTFATGIDYTNVTWTLKSFSFGGGTYTVDLSDENSKYNLNYPNRSGLHFLVATDETELVRDRAKVNAIKDYVDSDTTPTQWSTASDAGEHSSVKDNYFDTVYEIQKVRGSTYNINEGYYDGGAKYDNPLDPPPSGHTRGQQSDMTVYSQDLNTSASGPYSRWLEIKGASQADFESVGFTSEEAYSIAAVSGTFTDHSHPWVSDPAETEGIGAPGWATPTLQTEISSASMIKAADRMTCGSYDSGIIQAAVNINTATLYGIQTLFNIEDTKGLAIINTRNDAINCKGLDGKPSTGDDALLSTIPLPDTIPPYTGAARAAKYFAQRGELLMVTGIAKGIFQDCADLVTVRTNRFRIYSTGTMGSAVRRIEAVIDRDKNQDGTTGDIKVLYWSEKAFGD